jgi:demethylmenaquinone methyltransferase/2-methoxy-6-polyprenyl-1,4-benzoquinol methylase/phosphoethanolamine N-methyltransferase
VPHHTEGRAVRWARLYDLGTTLLSFGRLAALHRRVVDLAGVAPGERVLDVGCGPGRLAILAATMTGPAGETCGIDPAPEMIHLARRKAARAGVRVRLDVGAIEALPYPDDHFHVVLSSLMLHHLPDELKRRGLREVRRVLQPAGRFVAVDFGATPGDGLGHLLCVLRLRTGWDHAEHLREMLRDAGFETLESGPTGHRALAFVRGRKPAARSA